MQFEKFLELVPKISNLPLPGKDAQLEMAPLERVEALGEMDIEKRNPRWAAVMALFYPDKTGECRMALILRRTYKGVHSNQVGFPGGKVEPEDRDLEDTACRETEEEVSVPGKDIQVFKMTTKTYIPPSNFWVQPFMGYVDYTPRFLPQDVEVAAMIEARVDDLLDSENLITKNLSTSYALNIDVPAFKINGYIVWGATAMMLNEMKHLLRQAR